MQELKKNWRIYLVMTLVVVIGVTGIGYASIKLLYGRFVTERTKLDHSITNGGGTNDSTLPTDKAFTDETLNILLMASDESGLHTDSMMVIHYDQATKSTSLFSIPRDYRVEVSDAAKSVINYKRDHIKITEILAYAIAANYESPASLTSQAIEEMLNIELDYMVLLNIDGFKKLVDAVGGVEVNVPMSMVYDDPSQDLHINLEPGLQVLDGEKAEGFVRYRQSNAHTGYGDFGRMQMQQYFLKAFVKKMLSASSLLNVGEIYGSVAEFVTTDASLEDSIDILKIIKDADFSRVYSHTLPGENEKIEGVYYYSPPPKEELIDLIKSSLSLDQMPTTFDKSIPIKVMNGSNTKGMANQKALELTQAGYTVQETGTYGSERTLKTRIFVPRQGLGHDLKAFFELSEVIVDPDMFKTDEPECIIVVIGSLEQ